MNKIIAGILIGFLISLPVILSLDYNITIPFDDYWNLKLENTRVKILNEYLLKNWTPKSKCFHSGGGGSTSQTITETIKETVALTEQGMRDNWMREDCVEANSWCNGYDINKDGEVDGGDLSLFGGMK